MKKRLSIFLLMIFLIQSFGSISVWKTETEAAGSSKITLPDLISDHMLIQQNKPIKLWGTATAGDVIEVKLKNGQSILSEADAMVKNTGEFLIELPAVAAGGPYTLTFESGDEIATVDDVLVGELWVQSGQSNMERATSGTGAFASDILPSKANEEIRLFMAVADIKGTAPAKDLEGSWKIADYASVSAYSAVGYSALETLNGKLNIPVGGICNAIGGASMGQYMGYDNGKAGEYYYSKTAPLTGFNVAGIMWYQGEGDRGRTSADFTATFNKLIKTWREGWNDAKLPFVYVALPPSPMKYYASWSGNYIMEDFSSARLGQLQSYYENDNVAMAVSMDCPPNPGEDALHPNNKKPIGERLGLAALDEIYKVIENGRSPLFGSVTVDGNTAVIKFNHAYNGLKTTDGKAPRCFYVSESEYGKYYEAEAEIIGKNEVRISCEQVSEIKYVSYAVEKHMYPYSSVNNAVIDTYADVNLVNSAGLPACPFAYSVNEIRTEKLPKTFESIYADIYGIEVVTEYAEGDKVLLVSGDETIEIDFKESEGEILITPKDGCFETDKVYKLTVGDVSEEFKIKTLYAETFDEVENGDAEGTFKNFYGDMEFEKITTSTNDGSLSVTGSVFYQDNKLCIADSVVKISGLDGVEGDKVTFYADIEGYGKNAYNKNTNKVSNANAGFVTAYMGFGIGDIGSYAVQLKNRTFKGGTIGENSEIVEIDKSDDIYPNIGDITDNRFGFSKVTNSEKELSSYEYETRSQERKIALRTGGESIIAISDGVECFAFDSKETDRNSFFLMSDYRTLLVVDNILITCFTTDVEEPEKGEVKTLKLDADSEGLYLSFDRTLKGVSDFSKIHVYENETEINADVDFLKDEYGNPIYTELEIIPENYSAGNTYKVTVEEGFGTKYMWTYEETSYEKYIEPQFISVVNCIMNNDGITVTFDKIISMITDMDKVSVFENDKEIEADIEIFKEQLVIKPKSFTLGNTYKIIIASGFGTPNIYLEKEYVFKSLFAKPEIKIEKITGNSQNVYITYSSDISKAKPEELASIYLDDEEIEVSAKIKDNMLTLTTDEFFEKDVVYEIYVKAFELDDAAMSKEYRKQFKMREVLYEDFEDEIFTEGITSPGNLIADGNKASGITANDAEKNKRLIFTNGTVKINHPEVVEAENLDITFEFQVFNANLNNDDKRYDSIVPYSQWAYNRHETDIVTGYRIYLNDAATRNQYVKNGKFEDYSSYNHAVWLNGDAWLDEKTGVYHIYEKGDTLPVVKNDVSVSQREIPPVHKIRLIKSVDKLYGYRDGVMFIRAEPGTTMPVYQKGVLAFNSQKTEITTFDNISVQLFTLLEESTITARTMNIESKSDESISGDFVVTNYTDEDIPLKVVVCAYGDDNHMQAMEIIDVSSISAYGKDKIEFSLGATQEVKKIKVFLLKSLKKLDLYGRYEFLTE